MLNTSRASPVIHGTGALPAASGQAGAPGPRGSYGRGESATLEVASLSLRSRGPLSTAHGAEKAASTRRKRMARAIVRFSIQAGQIPLRNQVRSALQDAGFTKIGTSTFDA